MLLGGLGWAGTGAERRVKNGKDSLPSEIVLMSSGTALLRSSLATSLQESQAP